MIALIDGDILVYRVGFASENQTEAQNCMNTELVMEQILKDNETEDYKVFLSDKLENNFRFKIDPEYKANRKDARKPRWYKSIRQFLVDEFQAEYTTGQEADDALGIEQTLHNTGDWNPLGIVPTVICSIDKDLLQVPGNHYNITTREHQQVDYIEGLRNFYKQFLIGDRVDNIVGIDGLGVVKAGRLLDPLEDELSMFERVRLLYGDDERLLKNGQLLWVRRHEGEVWQFPMAVGGSDQVLDGDAESEQRSLEEDDAETK